MEFIFDTNNLNKFAKNVVELVQKNKYQFILLKGEIGSGKTTFVKEIAKELNENTNVLSPTFNFINIYDKFIHIDAYNLHNSNLDEFIDYFENKIIIIEWFENLSFNFDNYLLIEIINISNLDKRKYLLK
ncbi:MAG: tRNA (adenosine(37)-N6)-threonylcarbamoyltransferase complex ATPase subunit type 1 TsaE [Metamycoplasmataceae bacterium]